MRLPPTAWSSPCRRALSYWLVSFISARGNRTRRPMELGGPAFPPRNGTRPCTEKGQYHLLFPLLFVRCDVCCCGAVAPRVTVALLGRFLPRLGPLATASGPFFCVWLHLRATAAPRIIDHPACTDEGRRMVRSTIVR